MTRTLLTTAAASAALTLALGTTALAGQLPDNFSAIDANADGQVTYNEFSKVAVKQHGMTDTAAAQKFIKISNGNTSFTEGDLMTAIALQDDPNWGQTNVATNIQAPSQSAPISTPNTAVLSTTAGDDIPRWSDGTPVDLTATDNVVDGTIEAPSTYSGTSEIVSNPDANMDSNIQQTGEVNVTAPAGTEVIIAPQDDVMTDIGSTNNPAMEVWDESEKIITTDDAGATIDIETDAPVDVKTEMKTTVETPEAKIEVEPQPEK